MGAGCGFERSLLPRMASSVFHTHNSSTRLNFVATFGLSKAIANAISGALADTWGRKPVVIWGFVFGLPVMPYIIYAKSWTGITVMNGCFGLSQGLIGSALFFLIIDFMGPSRRGVAVGIGESTIYVSTALVNVLAGQLATTYGYRPVPFYIATAFAVLGLLSACFVKDTLDQVAAESQSQHQKQIMSSSDIVGKPPPPFKKLHSRRTTNTTFDLEAEEGSSTEYEQDVEERNALLLKKNENKQKEQLQQQQQQRRRKYARMMSTQPSHMDEDVVEDFYSTYENSTGNGGGSANGNGNCGVLQRTPSYQTFEGGMIPLWTLDPPPNATTPDETNNNKKNWSLSDETPPIRIPKRAITPKPSQSNFLIIENYKLLSKNEGAGNGDDGNNDGNHRHKRPSSPNRSRISGIGGGSRFAASRYSTVYSDAQDLVRDTGSVMVSVLLQTAETEVASSPGRVLWNLLRHNFSYVALCFAGMALNFKDGFAWGSFPVFFADEYHLSSSDTDLLIALYPLTWGFAQAVAGALSDRYGRKKFLIGGSAACAIAMASYALPRQLWLGSVAVTTTAAPPLKAGSGSVNRSLVWYFILSDIVLGLGTAFVYPALQAAAADEVDPMNRALALGFYRFIRDMGYVVGAVTCGHLTDLIGYEHTFWVNAAVLAAASSLLAAHYRPKTQEETAIAAVLAQEMMEEMKDDEEDEEEEEDVVDKDYYDEEENSSVATC